MPDAQLARHNRESIIPFTGSPELRSWDYATAANYRFENLNGTMLEEMYSRIREVLRIGNLDFARVDTVDDIVRWLAIHSAAYTLSSAQNLLHTP